MQNTLLKEVDKFGAEQPPLCEYGAPEVRYFDDDDEETISMAVDEGLLNLICSEAKKLIDSKQKTVEEIEEGGIHTLEYGIYIGWYPDEAMIWGSEE